MYLRIQEGLAGACGSDKVGNQLVTSISSIRICSPGGTGMRSQGSSSGTTCAPVLRDLMWGLLCWGASEQASPHSGQGTHSPPGIWTCSPRGHCMGMNKMEPKMETVSSALLHSTPPIFVTHTVLIPPRCPWSHIPGGPCIPMLQQYKQP